jgi:hypothetical protein
MQMNPASYIALVWQKFIRPVHSRENYGKNALNDNCIDFVAFSQAAE